MTLPEYLNCKSNEVTGCDYFISIDCKNSCNFAKRIKKGITYTTRTGLQRFSDKFPFYEFKKQKAEDPEEDYLGIGAMKVVPGEGLKISRRKQ